MTSQGIKMIKRSRIFHAFFAKSNLHNFLDLKTKKRGYVVLWLFSFEHPVGEIIWINLRCKPRFSHFNIICVLLLVYQIVSSLVSKGKPSCFLSTPKSWIVQITLEFPLRTCEKHHSMTLLLSCHTPDVMYAYNQTVI